MSEPSDETLYRLLVEQVADAVIYADTQGAIRIWNAAAERLFGLTAAEVLGKSLDLIIPESLRDPHWRGFDEAIARGSTKLHGRPMLTRAQKGDGTTTYVDMSFALLTDAEGKVVGSMAVARDAVARRDELKALRDRIAELEKAARPTA